MSSARFERATYSLGGCRSIQLSYEDTRKTSILEESKVGYNDFVLVIGRNLIYLLKKKRIFLWPEMQILD